MNEKKRIVIIIPTYNEALVIEETIHAVFKATSAILASVHLLIFDSCSSDTTQAIVNRLQNFYPNLHLQTEQVKTGLGSAYLQAMHFALSQLSADIVIEFDADLSHQPHYLPVMIEQMQDYDVVIGSRYIKGGSVPNDWGVYRKTLSQVGGWVSKIVLTHHYKDFTSGFRATNAKTLTAALPSQFLSNHYGYKLELLWNLHKQKARILEIPISFVDRKRGCSKLPANSIIDSLRVVLTLRARELKSYFSMCMVGTVGLLVQNIFYTLFRLCCSPFYSAPLAVSLAIASNFILNNKITFKQRQLKMPIRSVIFFLLFSLLMVGVQSFWVKLGIQYYGEGFIKENLFLASAGVLGSIINYMVYSRWVWQKKRIVSSPYKSTKKLFS